MCVNRVCSANIFGRGRRCGTGGKASYLVKAAVGAVWLRLCGVADADRIQGQLSADGGSGTGAVGGAAVENTPSGKAFCRPEWRGVGGGGSAVSVVAVYGKILIFSNCWSWMHKAISWLHLPYEDWIIRLLPWAVSLLALPMAFGYFLWFTDFIKTLALRLWRESDFTERLFLLGAGCLLSMMIVLTYMCTQAFYGAHINGGWFNFDLIYSADSGYLVHQDVFRDVGAEQNDLRQPLFGVFAMPFAQTAWLVSRVLFFLPNSYVTVSQILQMLLFVVSMVLLSRMMGLRGAEKAMFLGLLCVSYPVLIFTLTVEQYLFAVSWLILLIYLEREPVAQSTAYIAATGSLLTTGILFPLVTWDRDFKGSAKKRCCCVVLFLPW